MADTELMKAMGERIASGRKAMKWTQAELAEQMNVSTQMISNLEQGKKAIRPENLVKLCEALHISADEVLFGTVDGRDISRESRELLTEIEKLPPELAEHLLQIIRALNHK
ncbi:MAG: helix-turn-helix transcriptional regulator [Clostridia bacterium]|nr:helix-turn-helix transcriptional regulator [Clostridia bacterium]